MTKSKWMLLVAAAAVLNSPWALPTQAGLFKIDFGQTENERVPVDENGDPTGGAPDPLSDWNVIATWSFGDPNSNVTDGSSSLPGTANAAGTEVVWALKDFSSDGNNNVTLTMLDNVALTESLNPEEPPYMLGQTANNPTKEGQAAVYDGVVVPAIVKDDYLDRNPDAAGSEVLMRFGNLKPGSYNVTVFEGRTTDANGRYGKVWVDDITGKKEPAIQNTGNYAGVNASGVPAALGQPRTIPVTLKAGEYLWFAEMEDNSGGISGMIVRSIDSVPPPVDISTSKGLFKIDFGQMENERIPVDVEGNPTGDAPAKLADWNVIATWTFEDPNANVLPDSATIEGTANAELTEVTWKLTDFSKDLNKNVTVTMLDNVPLTTSLEGSPMLGQTANNPTKDAYEALYDGVVIPAIVKDDYMYRNPDTAGSEVLMRFAGLNAGTYNVTVFEGRTTDGNGRFGKVWVDDISGAKEPAVQNTGNYSGVNLDVGGIPTPVGNPRTVKVDLASGQYLWFAEMEDNSGGISGLIIRGIQAVVPAVSLVGSATLGGTYAAVAGSTVDTAAKTITVTQPAGSAYYRVDGGSNISIRTSGSNLVIAYQ